jgi:hypothetical protein
VTARPLTERQQFVLDLLRTRGPLQALDVGQELHARPTERYPGGKHSVDEVCEYCTFDGRSVLRAKTLAKFVVRRPARWELRERVDESGAYDPATAAWPVGF